MIRFLQTDNRITKAIFVVIIGVVSVGMVVYLIPGLTGLGASTTGSYAVVYPHWYSMYFGAGHPVSQQRVEMMTRQQLMQRNPQYADNPAIVKMMEPQVGQQLVQEQVLLAEAEKLGIYATDEDVRQYLHTGQPGQVLFPDGKFIGEDAYANLIATRFNLSVKDFEDDVKHSIAIRRLESLITAGVTVGDQEVRDTYRKGNLKIKFDYAVISSDDVRKSINPTDADLEAYFKKNAARYASAVPEERKITYFAFTPNELPGGVPQPSQQEIQKYFTDHQAEYTVPEQARSRHILIKVDAGADAKTEAAAKAKAEGILKELQAGGSWTDLAKKNSDDPGSKDAGGELGFAQPKRMVPEFDHAIFTQKIGDIAIVKSQFGYHIVQVEERQKAHPQQLSEVLPTIQATLIRQKEAKADQDYAQALTSEAIKNGLAKTAAAHHMELVNTPPVTQRGIISSLPDSAQLLSKAFQAKQGDAPQFAPTGEGYAIFQVTGVTPAHAPNFADWKSHVLEDYQNDKTPALLSQKIGELVAKAKAENDLAKAAKELGATVKTSDLVGESGQVPDLGQLGQVAPQLFDLNVGDLSEPIHAGRTAVVAKIVDKQEPSAAEIASSFGQTREQLLDQRRQEAFSVFLSGVMDTYKKAKLIRMTEKAKEPTIPGL
ncbi:MAG: peptidyl-prolyl cis-trans isomerase [Terracidiphilus sp.]|jgi:peptidyl-prolyl cis-trans isomerase D